MLQDVISFIDKKFNHPLVPLFFLLGAFFCFIGLAAEYRGIKIQDEFRYISIAIGLVCLICSIIFYYKPSKKLSYGYDHNDFKDIPESLRREFRKTFAMRKDILGYKQKELLNFMEGETKRRNKIPQEDLDKFSNDIFYRLESLIWMGFLEKEDSGRKRGNYTLFNYYLSPDYSRTIGR